MDSIKEIIDDPRCIFELKNAKLFDYNQEKSNCDDCDPSIPFEAELINISNDTLILYSGYFSQNYPFKPSFYQVSEYDNELYVFNLYLATRIIEDPIMIPSGDTLKFGFSPSPTPIPYYAIVKNENNNYKNGMLEIASNTVILYNLGNIGESIGSNVIRKLTSTKAKDYRIELDEETY
jgi:hypothetical protein